MASITRRTDKSFRIRISIGFDETGKRQFYDETFYPTAKGKAAQEKEAKRYANELEKKIRSGRDFETSQLTFREFSEKYWKPRKVNTIEVTTMEGYESTLERIVYPALGNMKLSQINILPIQKLYDDLVAEGKAPASLRQVHAVISDILKHAYKMNVPLLLRKMKLQRAEYVIFVPKDWNIKSDKEEDYWPIRMLKDVARLPIYTDDWLGRGHTVTMNEDSSPVASNTLFNSCVLLNSYGKDNQVVEAVKIGLFGDKVNFWQIFPLYQEELTYKLDHPVEDLMELLKDESMVIDIHRKNYCK